MAKAKEKNIALKLRSQGKSLKEISEKLKTSKSTVSLWCRDIILSQAQIKNLHEKMTNGGYYGRIRGARMQYEKRIARMDNFKKKGYKLVGKISKRDLLIGGIALYCGEGSKKIRRTRFTNSDPRLIRFMMKWFKEIGGVKESDFRLSVFVNKIHYKRISEIQQYWSKITGIPINQFTKTILIKSATKKNYDNFPKYYGTLAVSVCKSSGLQYLLYGLMEALVGAGE